jgi:hypothetical protein
MFIIYFIYSTFLCFYAPAYRRSDQELILYSSAFSLLKHHYKWEDINKHVFNDGTYRD